jgi:holo-[acyl-carrier protein] synthase
MLIGIDMERLSKVKNIIDIEALKNNQQGVINSIFCDEEIRYCLSKRYPIKHFAVRFAGKEAFLKALGTGLRGKILLSEIQFYNDELGKPNIKCVGNVKDELEKQNIKSMQVSFSHSGNNVVAVVILGNRQEEE